jgi:hypothetical protein
LTEAKTGIENLKETYSECTQTGARLDTILEKINEYCSEHNWKKWISE